MAEKLAQKQKELSDLLKMKEYTGGLVKYLEDISHQLDTANANAPVTQKVLSNWQNVFALMSNDGSNPLLQTRVAPSSS